MRFIDDISYRKTENGLVMLYHKKEGTLLELNETATAIAELLHSGVDDVDAIIKSLQEIYESDFETIQQDVLDTISEFVEYKILVLQRE